MRKRKYRIEIANVYYKSAFYYEDWGVFTEEGTQEISEKLKKLTENSIWLESDDVGNTYIHNKHIGYGANWISNYAIRVYKFVDQIPADYTVSDDIMCTMLKNRSKKQNKLDNRKL